MPYLILIQPRRTVLDSSSVPDGTIILSSQLLKDHYEWLARQEAVEAEGLLNTLDAILNAVGDDWAPKDDYGLPLGPPAAPDPAATRGIDL